MAKTIVVTGASKGIGKGVALKFAANGYNLALCARNFEALQQLKAEAEKAGFKGQVFIKQCDVRSKVELKAFTDQVIDRFGAVDVIFNNAGTFIPGSVYNEAEGNLETIIETNLYSAYNLTRSLLPRMIEARSGNIFNVCSVASIKAYSNGGSYSIAKYALLGFSKNLREEMKQFGIKVTAIIPGATYTDSWAGSGLPQERFMQVSDIADTVWQICQLSPGAVVEEILMRPILGDI